MPTATPPITRNTTRITSEPANPLPTAPIRNSTAATRIAGRRPYRSATRPAPSAPAAAPNSAEDTVKPSTAALAEKWAVIAATAPLMTELSYPNKNPPSAAVNDSRITVPCDSPGSKTSSSISTPGSTSAINAAPYRRAAPVDGFFGGIPDGLQRRAVTGNLALALGELVNVKTASG